MLKSTTKRLRYFHASCRMSEHDWLMKVTPLGGSSRIWALTGLHVAQQTTGLGAYSPDTILVTASAGRFLCRLPLRQLSHPALPREPETPHLRLRVPALTASSGWVPFSRPLLAWGACDDSPWCNFSSDSRESASVLSTFHSLCCA